MGNRQPAEAVGNNRDACFNLLTHLSFLKRGELIFPNKKAVVYWDKTYTAGIFNSSHRGGPVTSQLTNLQ